MNSNQTISELIDTVICGNKIAGDVTYTKMANSVTFKEIKQYCDEYEYNLVGSYWAPRGDHQIYPKQMGTGNTISKLDFFDKIIKQSF